jgi:hypothetical protein
VSRDFAEFPSEEVYQAFEALEEVDSITIDPHKQGYLPYPSGAYVCRDMDMLNFIGQKASYLYDLKDDRRAKNRKQPWENLGQFIMEGSKPGATAAAAYVTHRLIPLNCQFFGRLVECSIRARERLSSLLETLGKRLAGKVRLHIPFPPDSNILCFGLNREGNGNLALMNHFARGIFDQLKIDRDSPLQIKEFIGSYTSLIKGKIDERLASNILAALGVDAGTFRIIDDEEQDEAPKRESLASDHIFLFRHSLMSPMLLHKVDGEDYLERYCAHLETLILTELEDIHAMPPMEARFGARSI